MDPLSVNPLSVLTFIAAPAILTNASSVLTTGTATRVARAIDRARALSAQLKGREDDGDPETAMRKRQLRAVERRVQMLVRALTAYYVSVGSFAAATLASLLSAVAAVARAPTAQPPLFGVALAAGVVGVGGLVAGSGLLVAETRLALRVLREETAFMLASAGSEARATSRSQ
jgi:hypothetical protein